MSKILLISVMCGLTGAASAAEAFERTLAASYASLLAPLQRGIGPAAPIALPKARRLVRVSGWADLKGSVFVPPGSSMVHVYLSGRVEASDETGQISSPYATIGQWVWLSVRNGWASEQVNPYVQVELYKNYKSVGTAFLSGTIPVSGGVSGNILAVSGIGRLDGEAQVDER